MTKIMMIICIRMFILRFNLIRLDIEIHKNIINYIFKYNYGTLVHG